MQLTMQLTKTIQFLINGADYANKNKESFYGINYKSFDSQIFLLKQLSEKKNIIDSTKSWNTLLIKEAWSTKPNKLVLNSDL